MYDLSFFRNNLDSLRERLGLRGYTLDVNVFLDLDQRRRQCVTEAEQTKAEKKPPEIIAKMVEGRLRKYLAEITLVGQPFVKDPDTTVEKLLKKAGATVVQFVRYEVGAGIEKKQEDFVGEVMAQVKAQK